MYRYAHIYKEKYVTVCANEMRITPNLLNEAVPTSRKQTTLKAALNKFEGCIPWVPGVSVNPDIHPTWRFMGSYKWGYDRDNCTYNPYWGTYTPTFSCP